MKSITFSRLDKNVPFPTGNPFNLICRSSCETGIGEKMIRTGILITIPDDNFIEIRSQVAGADLVGWHPDPETSEMILILRGHVGVATGDVVAKVYIRDAPMSKVRFCELVNGRRTFYGDGMEIQK